ncbi:MAG TPA: cytochrome c oxidase subunit II [Verrucomicrobiae bacterium]
MEKLLGLPVLASEHGRQVDNLIIYIHWLMIVLFVGWLAYFGYTLLRFRRSRNPRADYYGVRNHSSSYIEAAVALVEGVLLVAVAVPYWARAVDRFPSESESTVIQVVAQQFAWNVRYPGKDGKFGRQDMHWVTGDNTFGVDPNDPAGKDDVQTLNDIHVPLVKNADGNYRPVIIYISSKDVVHSFKIIALRVTQDAIPGLRIPTWFRPTCEGRFQINCAQLCGNGHFSMSQGFLVVESPEAYNKWLASKTGAATSFE